MAGRVSGYQTGVQERLRLAEIGRAEEKGRAEEATKRARVERDRLRLTVALAASVLGLAMLGGGGAFLVIQQRQERLSVVKANVARIRVYRDEAEAAGGDPAGWQKALAAADAAVNSMRDLAGSPDGQELTALYMEIAEKKAQAERDRKLVEELANLRMIVDNIPFAMGINHASDLASRFASALRRYGLDLERTSIPDAVARLSARPNAIVKDVVGFLDHLLMNGDLAAGENQNEEAPQFGKGSRTGWGLGRRPRTKPAASSP